MMVEKCQGGQDGADISYGISRSMITRQDGYSRYLLRESLGFVIRCHPYTL